MSELTFRAFQAANTKRCPEAFRHLLSDWSLLEWAGAAAGEMGEVANVCKKLLRKQSKVGGKWAERDPEEAALMQDLADEIGDTLAYLSLLASAAGLDLGQCGAEKFDRISDVAEWNGPRLTQENDDG